MITLIFDTWEQSLNFGGELSLMFKRNFSYFVTKLINKSNMGTILNF